MIELEFQIHNEARHMHSDIELFYCLEGTIHFTIENQKFVLQQDDLLIVNADEMHSHDSEGKFIAVCMQISYVELSELLKQNILIFLCNSTLNDNDVMDVVRGIVKKIVWEHYERGTVDEIYINSLYYELLHVLTHDFLLKTEQQRKEAKSYKIDERKFEIAEYIRLNYNKPITLNELATKFYLSNAYLSKYIKRQFGMNFLEYVNSIRLKFAISQLLYSDKSVINIAMDTGFASAAALNKVFKEKYEITPSEYRSKWKNVSYISGNGLENEVQIKAQLSEYYKRNKKNESRTNRIYKETIALNENEHSKLNKTWMKMINVGTAADLLQSELQQHVLYLKQKLHIRFVRFWDIYSSEVYLDDFGQNTEPNFGKLDCVLDFLIENELLPYIELGVKPKKVIKNRKQMLIHNEEEQVCWLTADSLQDFLSAFLVHLINRYGSESVEKWYFEVWKPEGKEMSRKSGQEEIMEIESYLSKFAVISNTFHSYLPSVRVGGAGLTLRFGEENFRICLRSWKKHHCMPDFLSIYSYPYTIGSMEKGKNQTIDLDFLKNSLQTIRKIMEEEDFTVDELHVSEWNFTISNRNVLNDHCMKGAYLVKNMIDSIGLTDLLGYWTGSDLFGDYYDSNKILNGSSGLLSKDGICKPAFYAFEFMGNLGKNLYKKGKHYIVSNNGNYNWRIVCHNLKNLNYQYGLKQEDELSIYEQNSLMADRKKVILHYELPASMDGTYQIRIYSVNQKYGSVQDEWIEMAVPRELKPEDIQYLRRISIPRMVLLNVRVKNHQLSFDTVLEANEIQFIHAKYLYT